MVCETVPYLFVRELKHYRLIYENTKRGMSQMQITTG